MPNGSPLERLGIKAELEGLRVVQTAHVLLEQSPERLKTEIVSTRMLGSVMKLLTVYQPGGANERSTMLNFLVQPSSATSISEAIKGVRQWAQWRSRLRELRATEPDATLLIKGLDALSSALLTKHPTVHFRVASFREKLGVDYSPTSETATQLAEMLQAEFELLLHSAGDTCPVWWCLPGNKGLEGDVPVFVHAANLFRQQRPQNMKGRGPLVVTRCTLLV